LQRGFGIFDGLQRDATVLQVKPPLVGDAQLACGPLEQTRMQRGLELEEPRARGGRREAQLAAGRGQAAKRRGLHE